MSTDKDIEKQIVDKGLTAPRVTIAHITSLIKDETYTKLPSGKKLVCELTLKNGFTVTGIASVVSVENFDLEIGKKISKANAINEIWPFEGYLLQETLFNQYNATSDGFGD